MQHTMILLGAGAAYGALVLISGMALYWLRLALKKPPKAPRLSYTIPHQRFVYMAKQPESGDLVCYCGHGDVPLSRCVFQFIEWYDDDGCPQYPAPPGHAQWLCECTPCAIARVKAGPPYCMDNHPIVTWKLNYPVVRQAFSRN